MISRRYIFFVLIVCSWLVSCTRIDSNEQAYHYYENGKILRREGKQVEAMQEFLAALQTGTDDYILLGRVYSNMANMCRQAEQHDIAYEVYKLSAEQFCQANNPLAYAYALNNMAWERAVTGKKEEALVLIDSAVSVCDSSVLCGKIQETRAAACLYAGQYDSTLFYASFITDTLYAAILRAQAFTMINQYDSALIYAQYVNNHTTNSRYLDDANYILIHCDSTISVHDVQEIASKRTDIQREIENQKTEMAQAIGLMQQVLNTRKNTKNWKIIVILLLTINLGLIIWLLPRRLTKRARLMRVCEALRQSKQLHEDLYWDDYAKFCAACDEQLVGIISKLQNRGLNEREIRMCVLVMIGLSYSEIAEMLYRAESGIGKDKYVIAKKLGSDVKGLQNTLRLIACHQ